VRGEEIQTRVETKFLKRKRIIHKILYATSSHIIPLTHELAIYERIYFGKALLLF
jgi:hypothetical protein